MQSLIIHTRRWEFVMILVLCLLLLVIGIPRLRNDNVKTIRKYRKKNTEPMAADYLIRKWEHEHRKFSQQELKMNEYLQWGALEKKNMSEYCRKYLQQCVPGRTTIDAIGFKQIITLHYRTESTEKGVMVEILTCKTQKNRLVFHITRAPEPNCVYAASRKSGGAMSSCTIFLIINKQCDFEDIGHNRILNRKNLKLRDVNHFHVPTGQPIANDEILRQHELDHHRLHQIEDDIDNWPHMTTDNINEYCVKYLQKCIPHRNHNDVIGRLENGLVKYHKENVGSLSPAEILRCYYLKRAPNRAYYLTRALEPNCVYAILRSGGKSTTHPFQIIYKHCDFQHISVKLETVENSDPLNLIIQEQGSKIMLENSNKIITLQLFPQN